MRFSAAKFIREPLLHFLVLGAALFALNAWRETRRPVEKDAGPRIEVTAIVIERLRAGYERQFGRSPDAEELRGLVTAHIREEVLCREALALGLDRDDTIVRRRLAQKMEFLTDDIAGAAAPDDAVAKFFAENGARYARTGRVSFRHVYFSREKRRTSAEVAAREALAALEKGGSDEEMGDPFLHGFEFAEREMEELATLFGPEFTAGLSAQPTGVWRGPVASSYGIHLVHVAQRAEPRAVKLDEVQAMVVRDFNDERRRTANREVFEGLRGRYEISVDESALSDAAARANKTTQR